MSEERLARKGGVRTFPAFRKGMFLLRYLTQLREWYIARELKTILRDSRVKSVMDAGCGYGEYTYFVASRFRDVQVTALEMDGRLATDVEEFTRRSGMKNVRVVQGDVLGLDCRETFDLVLCGSVLEHIEEDETAISRLAAALKPGGVLLVYVPTAARRILPHFRRFEAEGRVAGEGDFGHVQSYKEDTLAEKIRKTGLSVQRSVRTYGYFGALAYEILYTFLPHSSRFTWKHWFVLPPYFLLLHPFVLLLMYLDFRRDNAWGNGLMVVSMK
jgi:SAM-dependent methyltransferase